MKARLSVAGAVLVVGFLLFAAAAGASEIKVMSSAGFKAAYLELAAEFERATGHKIINAWGPSMGGGRPSLRSPRRRPQARPVQ
jgi:molybdate transport system substrate-binding protein